MEQNTPNGQEIKSLQENHNEFLVVIKDAFGFLAITAIFFFLSLVFFKNMTDEPRPPVAVERGVK